MRKDRWENPGGWRLFGMFVKSFIVLFATLHVGYLHYWPVHFDKYTGEIKPKAQLLEIPDDEDPTVWRCGKKWDGYKVVEWGVCRDPNRTYDRSLSERPFVHPKMLTLKDLWPVLLSFFAAALALWLVYRLSRWAESLLVWHTPEEQKFSRQFYRMFAIVEALGLGYLFGWMSIDPDLFLYLLFIRLPNWLVVMIMWSAMSYLVYSSDFMHHRLNKFYANERRADQPPRTTNHAAAGGTNTTP